MLMFQILSVSSLFFMHPLAHSRSVRIKDHGSLRPEEQRIQNSPVLGSRVASPILFWLVWEPFKSIRNDEFSSSLILEDRILIDSEEVGTPLAQSSGVIPLSKLETVRAVPSVVRAVPSVHGESSTALQLSFCAAVLRSLDIHNISFEGGRVLFIVPIPS